MIGNHLTVWLRRYPHDNAPAITSCSRGDLKPSCDLLRLIGARDYRMFSLLPLGTSQGTYPCLDALALLGVSSVTYSQVWETLPRLACQLTRVSLELKSIATSDYGLLKNFSKLSDGCHMIPPDKSQQ